MSTPIDQKINILIVDDRIENIIALEALLQRDDINLITTTSPNEALKICWENDIAIGLIDVQMPEMDGFELVEILKSNPRTKDMLILFVTAISKETKYAVKGFTAGAVDYLYKPLDPFVTGAKVDSFISLVRSQRLIKQKNEELEEYQKELIKAKDQADQARKTKENFLANMSHELRTPINGIIGLAHLLKTTNLDTEQAEMVNLLDLSSSSLLGVINDILDISKIESGKFRIVRSETNIRKFCQSVSDLMKFRALEKGLQLEVDLDPTLPGCINADSLRLNQILINLLSNAIKFTERGLIKLRVRVLNTEPGRVELEFSVIDTGIGIADGSLHRVFDSFEQAEDNTAQRFGGTGLGLSIVKKLGELKGGSVYVESKLGEGSTFSFRNWFDVLQEDQAAEKKKLTISDLPKFNKLSVLVAEDNMVNQFMITKILKKWNINVAVVDDGSKVLDKLISEEFDLVLMDTHMPMMDGFEATRLIRTQLPAGKNQVPIISLSAAVLDEEQQAAMDAGVNDVLSKPFDPVVLYQKIVNLVGESR